MKKLKILLRLIGAIAFLGVVLVLGGMFKDRGIAPSVGAAPRSQELVSRTTEATREPRSISPDAVGSLTSRTRIDVTPRIPGQITSLTAEVGQVVEAGELLAELDGREFATRVEQARSNLAAAEAGAAQARAAFQRTTKLAERQAATAEQLETAVAAKATAEAGVAAARERLAETELSLGYARIVSPARGVVAARPVDPGDMAWPGKLLYTIHDPEALRIEAHVREGLIDRVAVGNIYPVLITSLNLELTGEVSEIVPSADPLSRSFLVRANLPTSQGLHPGMFGRLRLELDQREAVLVPAEAVSVVGQLHTVLVKHQERWVRRYVTIGELVGKRREVLSGLSGGETVGWND